MLAREIGYETSCSGWECDPHRRRTIGSIGSAQPEQEQLERRDHVDTDALCFILVDVQGFRTGVDRGGAKVLLQASGNFVLELGVGEWQRHVPQLSHSRVIATLPLNKKSVRQAYADVNVAIGTNIGVVVIATLTKNFPLTGLYELAVRQRPSYAPARSVHLFSFCVAGWLDPVSETFFPFRTRAGLSHNVGEEPKIAGSRR